MSVNGHGSTAASPVEANPPIQGVDRGGEEPKGDGDAPHERDAAWVLERLEGGEEVRLALPTGGRLHVDRPLPFLFVHRRPHDRADPGTDRLVTTEASYLVATGGPELEPELDRLVPELAAALAERCGGFLLIEVWSAPHRERGSGEAGEPGPTDPPEDCDVVARPGFELVAPETEEQGAAGPEAGTPTAGTNGGVGLEPTLQTLKASLAGIRLDDLEAEVAIDRHGPLAPPGMPEIELPAGRGIHWLGIEVRPVYRGGGEGREVQVFPMLLEALRRRWSRAVEQALFEFAHSIVGEEIAAPQVLGRRGVVEAVWKIDERLAQVGESFDFLLAVTPWNAEEAWEEFRSCGFSRRPTFRYRPLPVDVELLKRRLYALPLEEIEDPTLAHLFREKQEELDRLITMLLDRGSERFFWGSLQVFGRTDPKLLDLARELLERLPADGDGEVEEAGADGDGEWVDAEEFARLAREEVAAYKKQLPSFDAPVELRDDLFSGLMVSRGRLLVGTGCAYRRRRAVALLHHEIGTHLLTWFNGRAQRFRQLYLGLAGYEALQEGLAVFAEYLAGGLTRGRVRTLAGRVVAAALREADAPFEETFRKLREEHGFTAREAFTITFRIYRGGGFTKDGVYLEGLVDLLAHLGLGGEIEPLYVGKIAASHVPVVRELDLRGVLAPVPLTPRVLDDPAGRERLERARHGLSVHEMISS